MRSGIGAFYPLGDRSKLDVLSDEFNALSGAESETFCNNRVSRSFDNNDEALLIAYDEDNYCIMLDQFEHAVVGRPACRSHLLNKSAAYVAVV